MYQPITYSLLKSRYACRAQLTLFKRHFGKVEPIPLTNEVAIKFGSVFDLGWAAENLLNSVDYSEFIKITETATEKLAKATESEWKNYLEGVITIRDYNKITLPLLKNFEKVTATEFVRIYKKGMKK